MTRLQSIYLKAKKAFDTPGIVFPTLVEQDGEWFEVSLDEEKKKFLIKHEINFNKYPIKLLNHPLSTWLDDEI